MAKRMVTLRIDEDILRGFDEWCWEHRLSRTAAISEMMSKACGVVAAPPKPREKRKAPKMPRELREAIEQAPMPVVVSKREVKREAVIADLRAGLERAKTECEHPNRTRLSNYGLWKCEDCGDTWR